MQKISPFLWFDTEAEEAAQFYVSLFDKSKVLSVTRCGEGGAGTPGAAMTVVFELEGQRFIALNGGPAHRFTEAISFSVDCRSQQEVDKLWNALVSNGGTEGPCGWLKDRFGLSWQIVPTVLPQMLSDPDRERTRRVMDALLRMTKLDIAALQAAYVG